MKSKTVACEQVPKWGIEQALTRPVPHMRSLVHREEKIRGNFLECDHSNQSC